MWPIVSVIARWRVAVRRITGPTLAAGLLMGTVGAAFAVGNPPIRAVPVRELPPSTLAVRTGERWHVWWSSDDAPPRWRAPDPRVLAAVQWRIPHEAIEVGELRLAGSGEAWRVGVIIVRFDPAKLDFSIGVRRVGSGRAGSWAITDVDSTAILAHNAGQFVGSAPWGWVVHEARERRPPGTGPLAPAIVVDTGGRLRFVAPDDIADTRTRGLAREAFQSYPTLLVGDGDIPAALLDTGRGVDLAHRDSRLALGEMRDGRWFVALTRFEGLGGALTRLPFGLTAPEMAAVMGALGARQAVMLDGGISGQLLIRDSTGRAESWSGFRRVPMGWVGRVRGRNY